MESTCARKSAEAYDRTLRRKQFWRKFAHAYFWSWPPGVALLLPFSFRLAFAHFFATHVVAAWGVFRPQSQIFGPVHRRFTPEGRDVWLTIDDGPFPEDTAAMLEVLARHQAKATFFLEGARVASAPELARAIHIAGHTIGNHSHHHRRLLFWAAGPFGAKREISRATESIQAATGRAPIGFRPPVGMANGLVHHFAKKAGLPMIGWNARGYDGVDRDAERVLRRLLADLAPGSIILLHQHPRKNAGDPGGAELLDRLLAALAERGYRCILPRREQLQAG